MNVDFDFFGLNPEVDYHAINRLLIQLFGSDAESLQTGVIADLILSVADTDVGSTVKTDGEEGDPYAFLTVLSCDAHRVPLFIFIVLERQISDQQWTCQDNPAMKALIDYILSKSATEPAFHTTLSSILAPKTPVQDQAQAHLGLVLCERLINMPVQVIPPMYRMLVEEIKDAINDVCPY